MGLCEIGHLSAAKWLYSLTKIKMHLLFDESFRLACERGQLRIAQWLHNIALEHNIPIK
jgi:hypothetical protein